MGLHDLVNYTVPSPPPAGGPAPAAAAPSVTISAFLTPQSVVQFPVATGAVAVLWKLSSSPSSSAC